MSEQSTEEETRSSPPLAQTPKTLHINLPCADPEDVCFTILKYLIQIPSLEGEITKYGSMRCTSLSETANCCMDIIQAFAQEILDIVLPQVYGFVRAHGNISPTVPGLTVDQIRDYMGDSIEQALCKSLMIEGQKIEATKMFSQLLLKNIRKTVNTVLASATQTPIEESGIPMVFVSGCVTSITDLKDMVHQLASLLTRVERETREFDSLVYSFGDKSQLVNLLVRYISNMVNKLKSRAQILHFDMSSRNHRDVCIRVGTNTQILTKEDSESDGQHSAMSFCSDLEAIPGVVPENSDTMLYSENCPVDSVRSVHIIENDPHHSITLDYATIETVTEKLVDTFLQEDPESLEQTVRGGLELVDNFELSDFTDLIFHAVVGRSVCELPILPDGIRLCDTVIYKNLRRGGVNPYVVDDAVYMMTEEVLSRCVMQVFLWPLLCAKMSQNKQKRELDRSNTHGHMAGDSTYSNCSFIDSNDTLIFRSESPPTIDYKNLPLTMLICEISRAIGIDDCNLVLQVEDKVLRELGTLKLEKHFRAFLKDKNYKDMVRAVVDKLVLEFGSVDVVRRMMVLGEKKLDVALLRELREQLTFPEENRETICKKLKRLCCRKTSKKVAEVTSVNFLTSDLNSRQLDGLLSEESQIERRRCPFMRRITASTRKMYTRSKKVFSAIGRVLSRPFVACVCPEAE